MKIIIRIIEPSPDGTKESTITIIKPSEKKIIERAIKKILRKRNEK